MSDPTQALNVNVFPVVDVAVEEGKKICPIMGPAMIGSQAQIPGVKSGLAVPVKPGATVQPVMLRYHAVCVEELCPLWIPTEARGYCSQNPVVAAGRAKK